MEIIVRLPGADVNKEGGPMQGAKEKIIIFRKPNNWLAPIEITVGKEVVWVDTQELKKVVEHL